MLFDMERLKNPAADDRIYFDYAEHVSKPVQERVWNNE